MYYYHQNIPNIYYNYNQNQDKNIYQSFGPNDYEKIEKIGTGQFSTVYKVRHINSGDIYAMKVIEKRPENQKAEQLKQIKREIENLKRCYHWENNYNTVKLFNYFETNEQYILVFNFCDTTLEKYVEENYQNGIMPLKDIKNLYILLIKFFYFLLYYRKKIYFK